MTDHTDDVVLDDETLLELDQLALELTKRKETITAETERVKQIEAELRRRLPVGKTTMLGSTRVTVKNGARRLNTSRFEAAFPADTWPGLYRTETKPDTAAIKDQVAPTVLEAAGLYDIGTPVIEVR